MAQRDAIPREPEMIVIGILRDGIDPANIEIAFDPADHLSTGRSEEAEQAGTITVTPGDEGTVGGLSGQSAIVGGGAGALQHRSGLVYVDCWGGAVDSWQSADPQDVRADLKTEVYRALAPHYQGTSYADGTELTSLAPVDHTPIPSPPSSPTRRYGYRVAVRYSWDRISTGPAPDSDSESE